MKKVITLICGILFFLFNNNLTFGQNKNLQSEQNKFLFLLSPRGTETFYCGDEVSIKWDYSNVNKINIYYLNGQKKWIAIKKDLDSQLKNFKWQIGSNIPELTKILIVDSQDSNYLDSTQFNIRIKFNINQKSFSKSKSNQTTSSITIKKIMPLGDSITEGYQSDSTIYNGYRKKLKEILTNSGLTFDLIGSLTEGTFTDNQHEGHGGFSAKHWDNDPNYDLYSHLTTYLTNNPPDIVLFHIGTNDINDFKYSGNLDVADTTVSDVSKDLDLIYNFDPNIKVILAKITNRTDDASTTALNESVATTQFNIKLANMANARPEYGATLFLVDMESALTYPNDLSDGIHPNTTGYEKMSPIWLNGIRNILPKLNVTVFLEGAYSGSGGMNTNLNTSGYIPKNQPFNQSPWNFTGTEHADSIPSGVVDWVLVSLRSNTSSSSTVAERAGFLKSDGTIVDLDGTSSLAFVVDEGYYFVVVEHRNHLPIMSANTVHVYP